MWAFKENLRKLEKKYFRYIRKREIFEADTVRKTKI